MSWIKEHRLIVTCMIVFAICLGGLGIILVDMIDQKAVSSSTQASSTKDHAASAPSTSEQVNVEAVTENPFDHGNSSLTEDELLNYMHGMSHQKVEAEEKWIHYEMTEERIGFLLTIVENGSFKNEDLYLDILNRWAEGDFTQADKDHNAIWNLQGGTIGKATGVLSPEEEQQYLEDYKSSIK
ncbi:DUF6241 domain-containing protein [uncultured Metabacillus sp.]|uniref:DUF6241 domain-containing protein n=1 Tax=uncultured Metabacillus sp. TaxID=2860135 RepID=UPI00261EC75A|nr:DUF6241 domain-containing protein [uncultured Metabacillus sp.]